MWWWRQARVTRAAVDGESGRLAGWFGTEGQGFELVTGADGALVQRGGTGWRCRAPGPVRWLASGALAADGDGVRRVLRGDGWGAPVEPSPSSSPSGARRFTLGRIRESCVGVSYTRDGDELEEWRSDSRPWELVVHDAAGERWLSVGDEALSERLLCATWLDDERLVVVSEHGVADVALSGASPRRWVDWRGRAPRAVVASARGAAKWVTMLDGGGARVVDGEVRGELAARDAARLSPGALAIRDDGLLLWHGARQPVVWRAAAPGPVTLPVARGRSAIVGAGFVEQGAAALLVHEDGATSRVEL